MSRIRSMPIQPLFAAMIDLIIVKGPLGRPQPHHRLCLSEVSYSRFSMSKVKPTSTYIASPITGAQIELQYWIEHAANGPTAFSSLKIPVARATVGHNYLHAGLDSIGWEVACAAHLCRIVLTVLGFTHDEIERFMRGTEAQFLELTWHTPTAGLRAIRCLQSRTKAVFDAYKSISTRHDATVSNVQYFEGNGNPGLLIDFKNGDQFRQYRKLDQVVAKMKVDRQHNRMSSACRQHRQTIIDAIYPDLRNEPGFGVKTLKEFGLQHPSSWTPDSLRALLDHFWNYAGLRAQVTDGELRPEPLDTWVRYQAGEDVQSTLPPHTFSRHRKSIRKATGMEIAIPIRRNGAKPASVGRQLHYLRRVEPKGELRQLVLCESTGPQMLEDLKRGLEFLESGVVSDFSDPSERQSWLRRWKAFADREGGAQVGRAMDHE